MASVGLPSPPFNPEATMPSSQHERPPTASGDTRERILREAAALFADRGFDSPSVREICEAAGVSKPMLYYHFENKSGLITAVIAALHESFEKLISEVFTLHNASIEACIAGYAQLFDRMDEHGWTVRLWSRVPAFNEDQSSCAARPHKAEQHFATYVRAITPLPSHIDVEAAVWLLLAAFGPISMHRQFSPRPLTNHALAARLVRQALGVPAPDPAGGS